MGHKGSLGSGRRRGSHVYLVPASGVREGGDPVASGEVLTHRCDGGKVRQKCHEVINHWPTPELGCCEMLWMVRGCGG